MRTYSELITIPTFIERFRYLKLDGVIGRDTFGFDRWMNQAFYQSAEWKEVKNAVIVRDLGCDLGIEDREIFGSIYVHHMNPISVSDLVHGNDSIINPEFLICTSLNTHNAIHYGSEDILDSGLVVRTPGDTCPWRRS